MEEKKVNEILKKYNFVRTFPFKLVDFAKCLGYKIYYIPEKETDLKDTAIIVYPQDGIIKINTIYRRDENWFLKGRYLIAKMLSRIALGLIPFNGWKENLNQLVVEFSEQERERNNEATKFCFELLMPKKIFNDQWVLLGGDKLKLSMYFGVSQSKIMERHIYLENKSDTQK